MAEPLVFLLGLQNIKNTPKSIIPAGIKYQSYTIEVDKVEREVLIPLREADKFEILLQNLPEVISYSDIRTILREVRGILQ